jgi:hypothetical protein
MRRDAQWKPPDAYGYSWLLGFYLGDGCVSCAGRTYQLRVVLDARYPEVIEDCTTAVAMVVPHARIHVRPRRVDAGVIIEAASPRWPLMLPQHGPGRKHNRPIVLAPWQRGIVDAHPHPFEYPRYLFSNRSADIRGLFCEYCERLGIRTTQSNARNISVAHRASVAKLDAFVGPKT